MKIINPELPKKPKEFPREYWEGQEAEMDGLSLDDNPYTRDTKEWYWWRKGWFSA